MAYRYFDGAPFLYCWATEKSLNVQELNGSVSEYWCPFGFYTGKQLNFFESPDAVWCLRHDGVLFVGRNDGTFSGFRERDGLLVRYGRWRYPGYVEFEVIGQYRGEPVYLNTWDLRTVYGCDPRIAYILHKRMSLDIIVLPSLCDRVLRNGRLTIYTRGGLLNEEAAGAWVNAPCGKGRDSPLQL